MNKDKLAQMRDFIKDLPTDTVKNPYWSFDDENKQILSHIQGTNQKFDISEWTDILLAIRTYFREVYTSFQTEAQVLCVRKEDAPKLYAKMMPHLPGNYTVQDQEVVLFVLPQKNSYGLTSISEHFWQSGIVAQDIHPVARIHSHHVLDPYQSPTDYASLNSNTLELVIGHIYDENLDIGYWLDVRNTDAKDNVWTATQDNDKTYHIEEIPCGDITKRITQKYGSELEPFIQKDKQLSFDDLFNQKL